MTGSGRGNTRDLVLDAALALFSEKGFDGTAVTDIEREAGLSPGSGAFYRHFGSKDDAFRAVLQREMERARVDQKSRMELTEETDPHRALVQDYGRVLDGLDGLSRLIGLLMRERNRLDDMLDEIQTVMVEGAIGTDTALIDRFVAVGDDDPTSHEIATVAFTALVGLHLSREFYANPPGGMSSERYAEVLASLLLGYRRP